MPHEQGSSQQHPPCVDHVVGSTPRQLLSASELLAPDRFERGTALNHLRGAACCQLLIVPELQVSCVFARAAALVGSARRQLVGGEGWEAGHSGEVLQGGYGQRPMQPAPMQRIGVVQSHRRCLRGVVFGPAGPEEDLL